jgi:hypothetical protein
MVMVPQAGGRSREKKGYERQAAYKPPAPVTPPDERKTHD